MQVIGRATKKKSGLRFWNRALGIKANMPAERDKQIWQRTGLVGSVALAAWLLSGQVAFADTLTMPHCRNLPSDTFLGAATEGETVELTYVGIGNIDTTEETITAKPGTDEEGHTDFHYGKIMLPVLTAGDLTVASPDATTTPTAAALCRRGNSQPVAVDSEMYDADHVAVETAVGAARAKANDADTAATLAGQTGTTETSVRQVLNDAFDALEDIEDAWNDYAEDPPEDDNSPPTAYTSLATARAAIETELEKDPLAAPFTDSVDALNGARDALRAAATAVAALVSSDHMGFAITANIASGETEYIVVLASSGGTVPTAEVTFTGIMSNATEQAVVLSDLNEASMMGSFTFTTNTPRIVYGGYLRTPRQVENWRSPPLWSAWIRAPEKFIS